MVKLKVYLAGAMKSWTIWFNTILGIVIQTLPDAQSTFPQLQDYLPADIYHKALGALIVGNLLLRVKTNKALSER